MVDRIRMVFDEQCRLCDAWTGILDRADPARRLDTIDENRPYFRSGAILIAIGQRGGAWRLVGGLRAISRLFRDLIYRGVARRRYRLFGETRSCCIAPSPA